MSLLKLSFLYLLSLTSIVVYGSASDLKWNNVRSVTCAVGECKAGRCGFESCIAPTCRGGGCVFSGATTPTCAGGGCKFVNCISPTCGGGGCDFVSSKTLLLDGFCEGGGCTIDGFAAKHVTAGAAVY